MIGVFDVAYEDAVGRVGCLSAVGFEDAFPAAEWTVVVEAVEPYEAGRFWKRELAPLLQGIESAPTEPTVCVIDAYVDLGPDRTPGLGRVLYETAGIPVIGVAKSRFEGTPEEYEVLRGSSKRPLYVSAAGLELEEAKRAVASMAGGGRLPTLIRRADQLSRGSAPTH